MRPWPPPFLPALPGSGHQLRLYDTAAAAVRETAPEGEARLYVCGITPYDATHLGHAATYVAFDLVVRTWLDAGIPVHYVQNITDIDDPLLERAAATGEDWRALADRERALFCEDMTALAVIPPRHYVGAVESIALMVKAITELRGKAAAYDVDGDVYFPVHADPRFGEVAHLDRVEMLRLSAERGGDPERQGKKDPLDSLLWLAARPGEPSWDGARESGLSPGRPGWHLECAAIALHYLGPGIDVQGGGSDLVFPHHEIGASEAQILAGSWPFAKLYVHAGMVGLDGGKMSKSRGNLVLVSRLRDAGVDPMAIRLALLAHHYRSDWHWTEDDLRSAQERLSRWRDAVSRPDGPPGDDVLRGVRHHLADDLDAPAALGVIDRWAALQETDGGSDESGPGLVSRTANALLGIRL